MGSLKRAFAFNVCVAPVHKYMDPGPGWGSNVMALIDPESLKTLTRLLAIILILDCSFDWAMAHVGMFCLRTRLKSN